MKRMNGKHGTLIRYITISFAYVVTFGDIFDAILLIVTRKHVE